MYTVQQEGVCPQTGRRQLKIQVPHLLNRQRLDRFLAHHLKNMTRHKIQQAMAAGHILVNGRLVKTSYRLLAGDNVAILFPHPPAPAMAPEAIPLEIIYEDADLLVTHKPAGMVVHPTYANWTGTLANALFQHLQQPPGLVHRLDKNTSGLVLVAKHKASAQKLGRQFEQRQVEKIYLALVWGVPRLTQGTIRTHIGSCSSDRARRVAFPFGSPAGKPAITDYAVLEDFGQVALLRLQLHTGRIHQIRVHLQHLGCPIVSDRLYGGGQAPAGFERLLELIPRQALHAASLAVTHPFTGERMRFSAPLPADMQRALAQPRQGPASDL